MSYIHIKRNENGFTYVSSPDRNELVEICRKIGKSENSIRAKQLDSGWFFMVNRKSFIDKLCNL